MDAKALHHRARTSGVNPLVYWVVRGVLQPFFRLWFRLGRVGREHVPQDGPVLLAANHRSFLDPFVIATMARRPMYYVAKKELFARRWQGWVLNALGAFPVDRGSSDQEMLVTARAILDRGDCVLIFPEGTRVRPGGLGTPKRGVGRLALESGAPVVPIAVVGTDDIRRAWRIRPHRVTIRAGRALTFPTVQNPSRELAQAVTDRIWPCVALQWEWLGGLPPLRRAAVVGAGAWGTTLAVALRRAGLEVDLGTRTREQADALAAGADLGGIRIARASELELEEADVVVLAVPAGALAHVLAAHGERITREAGVVVASRGLVGPLGSLPTAFTAERVTARAVASLSGPARAGDLLDGRGSLVIGCADRSFAAQVTQVLRAAGVTGRRTADVTGAELAGVATVTATLAAATARPEGPAAIGAAAGRVFAEVEAHARRAGASPATFSGPACIGELVAAVVADRESQSAGQALEALDTLPLLAARLRADGGEHAAVAGLAEVVEGHTAAGDWLDSLTTPSGRRHAAAA